MGVVGSLPSPVSLPSEKDPFPILHEQTLPSNDEYSNDMVVSYDIIPRDKFKTNIIKNESTNDKTPLVKRYKTVSYGPLNVRVSLQDAPTLKTGRRSKFMQLEGDAAAKRELRRKRNRETAKKIKEKRTNIEHQLLNEINELESREKDLIQDIRNLESYKQFLEKRCQHVHISTTETTEKKPLKVKYHRTTQRRPKPIKTESRPSSPQWQMYFSI
jgi:hypothetical protein